MTAGSGIAHSEQTPRVNSHRLDGVQLWVALAQETRNNVPSFAAIEHVPLITGPGGQSRVFAGSAMGVTSEAPHYSPILGLDIELWPNGTFEVPLVPGWEHAAFVLRGDIAMERVELAPHQLHYMGTQRQSAAFTSRAGGRVLILGGPPFPEKLLMWWNFIGRTPEELAAARQDWIAHRRFPEVISTLERSPS